MTSKGRFGLLALAAVIAVVVFVLARPEEGSDKADDTGDRAGQTTPRGGAGGDAGRPTATAESALPPPPFEVRLRGGEVVGGVQRIEAKAGDTVRFVVISDAPDDVHVHGYDLERKAAQGKPARFRLEADLEGVFEIESHTAEDSGREPLIARLVVEPS